MPLTNQQLAMKLSMRSITTFISCPKCNYVTKSMELLIHKSLAQIAGSRVYREIFSQIYHP